MSDSDGSIGGIPRDVVAMVEKASRALPGFSLTASIEHRNAGLAVVHSLRAEPAAQNPGAQFRSGTQPEADG